MASHEGVANDPPHTLFGERKTGVALLCHPQCHGKRQSKLDRVEGSEVKRHHKAENVNICDSSALQKPCTIRDRSMYDKRQKRKTFYDSQSGDQSLNLSSALICCDSANETVLRVKSKSEAFHAQWDSAVTFWQLNVVRR